MDIHYYLPENSPYRDSKTNSDASPLNLICRLSRPVRGILDFYFALGVGVTLRMMCHYYLYYFDGFTK